MNYKLIEDKNGTIVSKGKRYKMNKLEYTKDDLIDIQSDYDLLYKKLDHYNKIINEQALEIARLKGKSEILEENNKLLIQQKQQMYEDLDIAYDKIDKAIDYIVKNCILSNEWTDLDFCNFIPTGKITYKQLTSKKVKNLLEILGGKENVKN